ncbi:redoxin domain-containing protein [Limnohabitans sp.]|jgi:cytochrome c biogenesis protein CcmG/thiol:disulfide interchange protein DsbE|uniref:redoxin domain-containing protein n=1 Tax=Limnohabitans sp. TaxID=1907725 RepID=UPI0039BC4EF7|nr:redoxin domain-containing protein [Comamonadaceae bacterium]
MSVPTSVGQTRRMPRWVFVPLALFLGMAVFLAVGLTRNPQEIPSPLIGQPAPVFQLPLVGGAGVFGAEQFKGQLTLVNLWATWCAGCKEEHPLLMALARQPGLQMVGINYKELQASELSGQDPLSPEAVQKATARSQAWLQKQGQAFGVNLLDLDGRVGMDFGVYGLPETYLVDRQGVVRFKHAGALTPEVLQQKLLPLMRSLQ